MVKQKNLDDFVDGAVDVKMNGPGNGARATTKVLDSSDPPINDIQSMFDDLVKRAPDMKEVAKHIKGRKLRVATMCSGTESPLLALRMIGRAIGKVYNVNFEVEHLFSCEIVPFKQAYIERNFQPPVLFRDVCELGGDKATTAYGAQVEVPGRADILIAGTSCVDYSTLNNEKQDITANGESGRTFRGMMSWVRKHRPPIVILENVCGAPWDKVRNFFDDEDYAAIHTRVDTKNYYIPHTRTRGYLFAVDRRKGDEVDSLTDAWKAQLDKLKRPASSPFDAFLLASDDPRIHQAREKLIQESYGAQDKKRNGPDWGKCESRHQRARLEEALGTKRPLTQWDEGGLCHMPSETWQDWGKAQVERVWDLMDITVLRSAKRGVDASYKSLVWNLSQNVDRQIGSSAIGICPCLTPSMIAYITNRGGPLIGLEALSLQGLPINELLLTRESEDNLADLAGNAMSSTVVGASIMSALIVAKELLVGTEEGDMDVDASQPADASVEQHIAGDSQLVQSPLNLSIKADIPLSTIFAHAQLSARLCICEGRSGMASQPISKCKDCGFTSCQTCGERPEHNYEPVSFKSTARLQPLEFAKELKSVLPMCLALSPITADTLKGVFDAQEDYSYKASVWNTWKDVTVRAFEGHFRFVSLKRQEIWVVNYESNNATLELLLEPARPQWSLFAKVDPDVPANSSKRALLSLPLARSVARESLLDGEWEFALPFSRSFEVELKGTGELVPSWASRLGLLGEFKDQKVWSHIEVSVLEDAAEHLDRAIEGTYKLYHRCGTATGALHRREEDATSDLPVYLFLDPTRSKDGDQDSFIFSTSIRRLAYGEVRPVIARLNTQWRQSDTEEVESVSCSVNCRWVSADGVQLQAARDEEAFFAVPEQPLSVNVSKETCHTANALLTCTVHMAADATSSIWPRGRWGEVDVVHERAVFQDLAWLTEGVRNIRNLGEWTQTDCDDALSLHDCERCAPTSPALLWSQQGKKTVAIEDISQAGRYEQALKHRPSPFVAQLKLENSMGGLRVGVNFGSLIHRALARLPTEGRTEQPTLAWRLTTEYAPPPVLNLPKFVLSSNKHDTQHTQPPSFKVPLREEQLRSLTWMLAQESPDAKPFIEEEVSEAMHEPLGWRAEGRATRAVHVRGGVLADQVGYGKTAITVGLIDAADACDTSSMPEFATRGSIPVKGTLIVVPPHLVRQWPSEIIKFTGDRFSVVAIPTLSGLNKVTIADIEKADIVVVASNLFKSEAYLSNLTAFAGAGSLPATEGRHFNARLKEAIAALRDQVEVLKTEGAKQVLSNIETRRPKVAEVEATVFVPSKRLKGKQYRDAVDGKKRKRSEDEDEEEVGERSSTLADDDADEPVTKKRKLGANKGAREEKDPWKLQSSPVQRDWKKMQSPPLECFYFQRLVIDEYTYLDGKVLAMVPKINASFRWILSGTPPVHDFDAVKGIATFLHLHLGVDDNNEGQSAEVKRRRREQTAVERFHSFREVHSPAWHTRRHEIGQMFLDQFVRQNIAEIDEIMSVEHIQPITLPAAERAIYLELEHHLIALDMIIKKGRKTDSDREKRLAQALGASESAHEALLKRCSHFDLDMDGSSGEETAQGKKKAVEAKAKSQESPQKLKKTPKDNATQACDIIVHDRQQQLDECKAELLQKVQGATDLEKRIGGTDEESSFRAWQRVCRNEGVGDEEASKIVVELLDEAGPVVGAVPKKVNGAANFFDKGYKPPTKDIKSGAQGKAKGSRPKKAPEHKDSDSEAEADEGTSKKAVTKDDMKWDLRERTHVLRKLEKELVARVRSLRYFTVVRDLQQRRGSRVTCSGCSSSRPLEIAEISILSSCGHMGCHQCVRGSARKEECILANHGQGCRAAARELNIVRADTLGVDETRDRTKKHYGQKLEKVIELIQHKIPKKERILIFVQFGDLTQKVADALAAHRIKFLEIKGTATQKSKNLEQFQDSDGDDRVLLLNVMDESASGANLTVANHAIFISPLLTQSKEIYEANETQAIGRLRRYGQLKTVHVWRFLTVNSIDVTIFEERTGRKVDLSSVPSPTALSGSPKKGRFLIDCVELPSRRLFISR